jgi:hypothetical protein
VKIILVSENGHQIDEIDTPTELAVDMMEAARRVLMNTRY